MYSRSNARRLLWTRVAPVAAVAALALAFFVYYHSPRARSYHLRMTAGDARGTRHHLANLLRTKAAPLGLRLDVEETAGSEEALDLVNAHKLDVALVQGALRVDDRPRVRQVATLGIEPLHLLVKSELAKAVSAHLTALEGRTIHPGSPGSGTHSVTTEVLSFAGLRPRTPERPRGYVVSALSHQQLATEQDRGRLPDAVFLVSSLPAELARTLVQERDFRLVPLGFGEAFSLDGLNGADASEESDRHASIEKGRIGVATIPAYVYRVEPPVPETPLPTLGTRLLLVAHQDVDAGAVRRLMDAVYGTEFASASKPPLDAKLLELPPEFPWHDGTRIYLQRNTPVVSGVLIDVTQKGFAIFAAAASGLFVLWQWLKQRGRFLRDRGFNKYISEVTRIEERAARLERLGGATPQQFLSLRDDLLRLKTEALDAFTEGELAGHELMQGFLVQVNDVRDYVTRLVAQSSKRSEDLKSEHGSVTTSS
jgi:TRAP-type uncharacterized transport system substrate-binding protein